jgi:hypothetical protein
MAASELAPKGLFAPSSCLCLWPPGPCCVSLSSWRRSEQMSTNSASVLQLESIPQHANSGFRLSNQRLKDSLTPLATVSRIDWVVWSAKPCPNRQSRSGSVRDTSGKRGCLPREASRCSLTKCAEPDTRRRRCRLCSVSKVHLSGTFRHGSETRSSAIDSGRLTQRDLGYLDRPFAVARMNQAVALVEQSD